MNLTALKEKKVTRKLYKIVPGTDQKELIQEIWYTDPSAWYGFFAFTGTINEEGLNQERYEQISRGDWRFFTPGDGTVYEQVIEYGDN